MRITGPLVVDGSLWDNHVRCNELVQGGVVSFILGLYQQYNKVTGKYDLHDNCKRIADQLAADGRFIMQAYYYVVPENDPYQQADWFIGALHNYGYPFRFAWSDCEDYKAAMTMANRSLRYQQFTDRVATLFSNTGVYTGKWFVDGFAPDMNAWLPKYLGWPSHYGRQPTQATLMSWEELKANWLPNYDVLFPTGMTNRVVGHQFTGDRCYLPGLYCQYDYVPWWPYKGRDKTDVSVFDVKFLNAISGSHIPVPPIPSPIPAYVDYKVVPKAINVRKTPDITGVWVRYAYKDEVLHLVSISQTSGYVQMTDKNWVSFQYLVKA
jgi:hypothetical protein